MMTKGRVLVRAASALLAAGLLVASPTAGAETTIAGATLGRTTKGEFVASHGAAQVAHQDNGGGAAVTLTSDAAAFGIQGAGKVRHTFAAPGDEAEPDGLVLEQVEIEFDFDHVGAIVEALADKYQIVATLNGPSEGPLFSTQDGYVAVLPCAEGDRGAVCVIYALKDRYEADAQARAAERERIQKSLRGKL